MIEEYQPDRSWLHGKYEKYPEPDEDGNEYKYDVHTSLPYIAIGKFFCQGEEADKVIDEIHQIWLKEDITELEAIKKWENMYL